jgi:hypothetical protein
MTDDTEAETPSRRPGRPRGSIKKRNAERMPTHAGRSDDDHQDPLENFEYRPFEAENPLSIDPEIVRGIEREWGYSLLWVMFECNGKPFPDRVNARKRNGYSEIRRGNFNGALDHMCNKDNRIVVEGLVLIARPTQIQRIAEQHDKRAAKAAIENMRRSHAEEGVGGISMPEGNTAAARAKNRHRQTFEPFDGDKIPD